MQTSWVLSNRGDVSGTLCKFVRDVWLEARLKGMVVPRKVTGTLLVAPTVIRDWLLLDGVDAFAPIMLANSARLVADTVRAHPNERLGALLRPCEVTALGRMDVPRQNLLVIGVECSGTYWPDEYVHQVEARGPDNVTRELVAAGRRRTLMDGGVPAARFRPACQMCEAALPEDVDLHIAVVGPATRELLLVWARDEATARRLRLHAHADREATGRLLEDAAETANDLQRRRQPWREHILHDPAAALPRSALAHFTQLSQCAPCHECLEACPQFAGQFSPAGNLTNLAGLKTWAANCAQCGMCEAACPSHQPLTAIMAGLRDAAQATAA